MTSVIIPTGFYIPEYDARFSEIMARDGLDFPRCAYCGINLVIWNTDPSLYRSGLYPEGFSKLSYEHIVPKSRGGDYDIDNLSFSCPHCNSRKGVLTALEFTAYRILEGGNGLLLHGLTIEHVVNQQKKYLPTVTNRARKRIDIIVENIDLVRPVLGDEPCFIMTTDLQLLRFLKKISSSPAGSYKPGQVLWIKPYERFGRCVVLRSYIFEGEDSILVSGSFGIKSFCVRFAQITIGENNDSLDETA